LIEPHEVLSVAQQCRLLELPRSSFYYQPASTVEPLDLELMRLLDLQYTATPFYGSRRMTMHLRGLGHLINRKHVIRLMRLMGLEALYPKPRLSGSNKLPPPVTEGPPGGGERAHPLA
jgi:putative transposase